MNPFGLISGMQNFAAVLPGADRYESTRAIPLVGGAVELRPGMTFALEPNCALGKRVVNLGGTVVVGEDEPLELNRVSTRLMRV